MKKELEWTESARNRWEQFLAAKVQASNFDAEAAQDLREDLTLHLEEDLVAEKCEIVTLTRVEKAVADLGGQPEEEFSSVKPTTRWGRLRKGLTSGFIITWGVVMPLLVFGLEFFTGFCGSVFFDPLESWIHVVAVGFVIASNWWLLTTRSRRIALKWRALAAGSSLGMSTFFGLLFVPLIPLSCMAVLILGMGLLSLTPVLNVLATWSISRRHREVGSSEWNAWWKGGLFASALLLVILQVPSVWTRLALNQALSEKDTVAERGLAQLRTFHSEKTLLRACYEGNRGTSMSTDISGWLLDGWQLLLPFLWEEPFRSFSSEDVRTVYYRVTGDAYNTQPPPSFIVKGNVLGGGADRGLDQIQWDDHLGGEEVAVRLANLDLVQSRIDGHLDAPSGLTYQEWTMVFRNENSTAQEARLQMLLPEDGVVSRVTLWVNGEPQEAAFSSKSKVRAAYEAVAVRQSRDPVLVTATGPGRVLVQCFPVPADGGEMKIRIGMTAPLKRGKVATPILLERNFGVGQDLETSVWMQGPQQFSFRGEEGSHRDGAGQSLQIELPSWRLQQEGTYFACEQEPSTIVWSEDQFAEPEEAYLTRTWQTENRPALSKCILVVDGSASMADFAEKLEPIISDLGEKITVVIADDGVSQKPLKAHRFEGGRDNGPALEWAMREARKHSSSAVVWLHGPQPLASEDEESLAQLFERGTSEVSLYSIACKPGGNRLLEKLFKNRAVQMGPRLSKNGHDLGPWLTNLIDGGTERKAQWSRSASLPTGEAGLKVWDQLARWWAVEKVRHGSRQQSAESEAIQFAAKYQLVTAYSGAVVLETAQQYLDHGLEQVDTSTTPNIPGTPEPGTWLLVLITGVFSLMRRKRS